MSLSTAERQARYRKRLKERATLQPEAVAAVVRQWVEEALAAWDEIQPEDECWRAFVARQKTSKAALAELVNLSSPDNGDTPGQKAALARVRLLLEALALR